ncbi:MAG TPA: hypothetical protein VH724_16480 [Candidatus Angelobacter sp.]|jgi:hypothetical protein|nr:hypothetical protein [Candidatus Angelobacter sp.]
MERISAGYDYRNRLAPVAFAAAATVYTYNNGTRLSVYLSAGATDIEGKLTLDCLTATGDKLGLALFVTGA